MKTLCQHHSFNTHAWGTQHVPSLHVCLELGVSLAQLCGNPLSFLLTWKHTIIQARLVDLMPNQEPCFQTGLRGAQAGQAGSIECDFLLRVK